MRLFSSPGPLTPRVSPRVPGVPSRRVCPESPWSSGPLGHGQRVPGVHSPRCFFSLIPPKKNSDDTRSLYHPQCEELVSPRGRGPGHQATLLLHTVKPQVSHAPLVFAIFARRKGTNAPSADSPVCNVYHSCAIVGTKPGGSGNPLRTPASTQIGSVQRFETRRVGLL